MKYLLAMLGVVNIVTPTATMAVNQVIMTNNENQEPLDLALTNFRQKGKEIVKLSCGDLNLNDIKQIEFLDKDIQTNESYARIQYINYYRGTSFVINKDDYEMIYKNFTITKETKDIANRPFVKINSGIINLDDIKFITLFGSAIRTNEEYAWINYQFLDPDKGGIINLTVNDYQLIYKRLVVTKNNTNIKDKHLLELNQGIFNVNDIKAVELIDYTTRTPEKYASLHYMDYYQGPRFVIDRNDYWVMLNLFSVSKENRQLENRPLLRLNEAIYNIKAVKEIELLDRAIRTNETHARIQYSLNYQGPNFIIDIDDYNFICNLLVINKRSEDNKKPYFELSDHKIINTKKIKFIKLISSGLRTNEEYATINYLSLDPNKGEVINLDIQDYKRIYNLLRINKPIGRWDVDDRNERFLIELNQGFFNVNDIKFFHLINQTRPNTGKWCELYYEDYYQGSRFILSREDYDTLIKLITF